MRIGTCSWKYDSWKGLIYPDFGEFNYLEEYSKQYNTVEIDQWFWSLFQGSKPALPKESTVNEYNQSVPEDFKFTINILFVLIQFYNYITLLFGVICAIN